MPLLSMQSSVLLCISTLLDGANHYSKMCVCHSLAHTHTHTHTQTHWLTTHRIALTGPDGKKVFESIAITLVCGKPTRALPPFQILEINLAPSLVFCFQTRASKRSTPKIVGIR